VKKAKDQANSERLYLGVDVGGTKVQASVVEESGGIVQRLRRSTPRDCGPEQTVATIEQAIDDLLAKAGLEPADLTAVGVAIPGVVDPGRGSVVVTPNMALTGVEIGPRLEAKLHVPVAVGNDCNLGALGETWLGSARKAKSVVAILVGTGIGGGYVQKGKLWRGAREAAGEIGHIVMQIDGPACGCGNRGCLEALASRTAIERDIRQAVAAGRETLLMGLAEGNLNVIRSSMLRKALAAGDALVTEVMRRASELIGYACLTVRHLIDPEVIVLGGGVVEACGDFMVPIVEDIVGSDKFPGARQGGRVLLSALGDDAVVVGAVVLARRRVGRNPFKKAFDSKPRYPEIVRAEFGQVTVGEQTFDRDIYILVNGKVTKRDKALAKSLYGSSHTLGPEELQELCAGGPELLIVGAGHSGQVELREEARRYLDRRAIKCRILPTPKAIEAYNKSNRRKAAVIHVTC
jgi:glucokinase